MPDLLRLLSLFVLAVDGFGKFECDVDSVVLSDFEVWQREAGYWYGEYTFLGADGDPFVSEVWNYGYQPYHGFIYLETVGYRLMQRNVFVYPPQDVEVCETNNATLGDGVCGVNGNEKIFLADQLASDCDGQCRNQASNFRDFIFYFLTVCVGVQSCHHSCRDIFFLFLIFWFSGKDIFFLSIFSFQNNNNNT